MPRIYTRKETECHPERKHFAHGLCRACYVREWGRKPEQRAKQKVYRDAHAGEARRRAGDWFRANRERAKAANRSRYEKKREQVLETCRKWQAAHPELKRQYNQRWRLKDLSRTRLLCVRKQQRRAASIRGNPGTLPTTEQLAQAREMLGRRCYYCGECVAGKLCLDHVVPLSSGGSVGIENLVPACGTCNTSKGRKEVRTWLATKTDPRFQAARRRMGVVL